jgi:hypothetical protein
MDGERIHQRDEPLNRNLTDAPFWQEKIIH